MIAATTASSRQTGMVGPGSVQLGLDLRLRRIAGMPFNVLSVSYAKTTLTRKRQKPQTVLRLFLISLNWMEII